MIRKKRRAHIDRQKPPPDSEPPIGLEVLPSLSIGEMTLRPYGALNYSKISVRDLRRELNVA